MIKRKAKAPARKRRAIAKPASKLPNERTAKLIQAASSKPARAAELARAAEMSEAQAWIYLDRAITAGWMLRDESDPPIYTPTPVGQERAAIAIGLAAGNAS